MVGDMGIEPMNGLSHTDTKLSVNLNKVALLRNQRHVGYPAPVAAGRTILEAGAHGLTVHPRPDERHIRKHDVDDLDTMLRTEGWYARGIEFNIEGNPYPEFMDMVLRIKPHQATLVPDGPDAATSDSGWDVFAEGDRLKPLIGAMHDAGIRVSLFMDAVDDPGPAMERTAALGADRIELYTGPYADAFGGPAFERVLERYRRTAEAAVAHNMAINAGHDLTIDNLPALKSALPRLDEVSIGHAFTADALWMGFERTVAAYIKALSPTRVKRVA